MSRRDPEPLDQDLLGLLEAERKRPAPAVDARARVLARVLATVGGPGGGPGGSPQGGPGAPGGGKGLSSGGSVNSAAPSLAGGAGSAGGAGAVGSAGSAGSAAASLGGSALGKGLIVGLAALALGAAVLAGALSTRDAAPELVMAVAPAPMVLPALDVEPPASAPVIAPSASAPPVEQPAPLAEPPPSVPPPARSMEPGSGAAGRDTALAAERAILESARTLIAGGQKSAGFEALQQHAREFPRGQLAEEREGLWIRALIASGRMDEARARFARFRRIYPRSMLLPGFAESLGVDSVTSPEGTSQ